MLLGEKPRQILEYICEKQVSCSLSYMTQGRWNSANILVIQVHSDSLLIKMPKTIDAELFEPDKTIGISFECDIHGGQEKFIFGSQCISTGYLSTDPGAKSMTITMPEDIEVIRKKSLHRTEVPIDTNIGTQVCHRSGSAVYSSSVQVCQGFSGRLINISAEGLAVAIPTSIGPDFSKDQYVSISFTPFENETQLSMNGYVRRVEQALLSEDMLLDLELAGLEASCEGRMVLRRLCNTTDRYRQQNIESTSVIQTSKQYQVI